jgi:hypothetical protein
MSDHNPTTESSIELYSNEEERRPLIPENESSYQEQAYIFRSNGTLAETEPLPSSLEQLTNSQSQSSEVSGGPSRPCSLSMLDGSWYLQLRPQRVGSGTRPTKIHGPMRIESRNANRLRISGDIYIESHRFDTGDPNEVMPEGSLVIRKNWYPQLPPEKYSWYFRSQGVRYSNGELTFDLERHIWDPRADDFTQTDSGTVTLDCTRNTITHPSLPQATIQMTGQATFGGTEFHATATKSSSYYRGCHIETDVMTNRHWTGTASTSNGDELTFDGVYRNAGLEFSAVIDEIDIPDDADLSATELHQLLSSHRIQNTNWKNYWHLWLVIGSQLGTTGTLGIMFDDQAPFREGTAAFYDPLFSNSSIIDPSAQGKKIGEVPLAILRTALHEVGHAFNLFHPKHDTHPVPIGTTIMNQTGDVMGFASPTNPYPNNATFAFHDHNSTSLIHSPDPQIRPGWTPFGYSHGGTGNAPSEPNDLTFDRDTPQVEDLELELSLPNEAYPGELVIAAVRIHNTGDQTRDVTTALNLEEDYLTMHLTPPGGNPIELRDVVLVCSDRQTSPLEPDDYRSGYIQLLYTNQEYTFDQAGSYTIQAELDLGDHVARSEQEEVLVRSPISENELELSARGLDTDVGRSVALGFPPLDTPRPEEKLTAIAEDFPETDLGTAAGIIVANARSKDTHDYRADEIARSADEDTLDQHLDIALQDYEATDVARIATAVMPVGEPDSPIFDQLVERSQEKEYEEDDINHAQAIFDDYRQWDGSSFRVEPNNR